MSVVVFVVHSELLVYFLLLFLSVLSLVLACLPKPLSTRTEHIVRSLYYCITVRLYVHACSYRGRRSFSLCTAVYRLDDLGGKKPSSTRTEH